jgi:hypothetical protein
MPRVIAKFVDRQCPSIRDSWKPLPAGVVSVVGLVLLSAGSFACGQERSEKSDSEHRADFGFGVTREAAIKSDATQVQDLKQRAEELREKQRELRHAVQKTCGLSPENVAPILLGLERDRFNLEIEVKLKTARRESIARMIAEQTKRARDRAGTDEIVAQLKKLTAARQGALKYRHAMSDTNTSGGSLLEVSNAEADLADAEIRLATRKEELGKTHEGGDEVTDRLNRQLLDVSVELTQDELRLQLLDNKLNVLGTVQNLLDDYKNTTESELPRVLRLLDQAETQLAGLKYPN